MGKHVFKGFVKSEDEIWNPNSVIMGHNLRPTSQKVGPDRKVLSITAIGTRGDAKGKLFVAKPDSRGRYVLNKKRSLASPSPTNYAVNKVYVDTLDEVVGHLETGDYLVNLVGADGQRALRALDKVTITRAGD